MHDGGGKSVHRQALPGVLDGVQLQEVVLTAVAGNLQLRPHLRGAMPQVGMVESLALRRGAAHGCMGCSCGCLHMRQFRGAAFAARKIIALTLYRAPCAFACSMDWMIRRRLPSKSSAHWFRLHVARVASR